MALAMTPSSDSPVRCPQCHWHGTLNKTVQTRNSVAECPKCRTPVKVDRGAGALQTYQTRMMRPG